MPEATLQAVAAYGDPTPDTITGSYDDARSIIEALARAGVDLDDVALKRADPHGGEQFRHDMYLKMFLERGTGFDEVRPRSLLGL